MANKIIHNFLKKKGYRILKDKKKKVFPTVNMSSIELVELDALVENSSFIPSMLSPESGKFLYSLCYMQLMKGDVVEIGSWQGYSSSFLAKAVLDSDNGNFYAIDHFKGNVNKEDYYKVAKDDLSDLEENFRNNMKRVGVGDTVNLLNMPNDQAVHQLKNKTVRFLFIDGDHTAEGVQKDIDLFFPLLSKGSIVVFDDFRPVAKGVYQTIDRLLKKIDYQRAFSYDSTFVLML